MHDDKLIHFIDKFFIAKHSNKSIAVFTIHHMLKKGACPVVVDAIDLQTHPDETMKSYCETVGIQFDPNMTTWEKGSIETRYKLWSAVWHSTVNQSTGFIKIKPEEQKPVPLHELPQDIIKYIDESRFCYEEMKKACLKVKTHS